MGEKVQIKVGRFLSKKGAKLGILSLSIVILAFVYPYESNDSAIKRIVIDAGHGGKDPGNLGTGRYNTTEKTIALNVSLQVGEYIRKAFPEIEVLYTRNDDESVKLHERTKFANSKSADLFISIHCDAFTREAAYGCGSYVMGPAKTEANLRMAKKENQAMLLEENQEENYSGFDPNSPEGLIELSLRQSAHIHQSLKFAKFVQDQMRTRVGRKDRGVRQAPYWVISFTTMPSVLIELGFLTNKKEEDFLNSKQGQEYMASAIYRAFKEYKKNIEELESTVSKDTPDAQIVEKPDKSSSNDTAEFVFKIQLASSSKPVDPKPENFKGLENVEEYRDNDLYKYLYGSASTYEGAKNLQKSVRQTGYRGAFVVAFDKNNNRVALSDALEQTKNK